VSEPIAEEAALVPASEPAEREAIVPAAEPAPAPVAATPEPAVEAPAPRRPSAAIPAVARSGKPLAPARPPFGFWKGLVVGGIVVVPAIAAAVWTLARLGIGKTGLGYVQAVRFTGLFAGIPALLTAAGIGRLAAQASIEGRGGRLRAVWMAALAQAASGIGLIIIAAMPNGDMPMEPARWGWLACGGVIAGALCGAVIGLACGGPMPDVSPRELARDLLITQPTELLRRARRATRL
jgi:hypothetical protein